METDVPNPSYRIVRKFVPRFVRPYIREFRKRLFVSDRPTEEPYRSVFPYTQVDQRRQRNLVKLARDIDANEVPGAIVECGVLDGGTAALLALTTKSSARTVHLFDVWKGRLPTHAKDGVGAEVWANDTSGSANRVKRIMRSLGVDVNRLIFHEGLFSDTFPQAKVDQVALVHADGDYYESTKLILNEWYPKLSRGGYIQFDDYTAFIGCQRAVNEFLAEHSEVTLRNVDNVAFFIRKD